MAKTCKALHAVARKN